MTPIAKRKKPWRSWKQQQATKASRHRKAYARKLKRIKEVFKIYKRVGTLAKTGEVLGVTRERVRAILDLGCRTKTIVYVGAHAKPMAALFKTADRAELLRDLETALPGPEFCAKYRVTPALHQKLQWCAAKGINLAEI